MVRNLGVAGKCFIAGGLMLSLFGPLDIAAAHGFRVLYKFAGPPGDGGSPVGDLLRDTAGNLYGATFWGGPACASSAFGCGTVFRIAPDGTETVLYSFKGGSDGVRPNGGLIQDTTGVLYGTTLEGGASCDGLSGCGTVFKIAPDGTETVLHAFQGGSDGVSPEGGLIADAAGNLYGTTAEGGGTGCGNHGCGTVFKLATDGTETIVHAFVGGSDGRYPQTDVTLDGAGNLFGTTNEGGGSGCGGVAYGCGTAFKIAPDGSETVLHAFTGGSDGGAPTSSLIIDKAGNLYGVTGGGGLFGCRGGTCGTVYKIAKDGSESVLYDFSDGSAGFAPDWALVRDRAGNLYGTTVTGGNMSCPPRYRYGCGTVFKLAPNGNETVLYAFKTPTGAYPEGVIADQKGNLYGTAYTGGTKDGWGTVFTLRK